MITADQIVIHAIGDYILQSDWMATEKTKQHTAAFCHALVYSLPFLAFRPSLAAWLAIFVTHFFIDRYRLARYIVWAKNFLAPRMFWVKSLSGIWSNPAPEFIEWGFRDGAARAARVGGEELPIDHVIFSRTLPWANCSGTGYPPDRPAWLAVWLLIFADNILHICINGAALRWL